MWLWATYTRVAPTALESRLKREYLGNLAGNDCKDIGGHEGSYSRTIMRM